MNRIKELRRKYPMTQAELAKALHISQASVSGYESGNYEPDFELTKRMADLFGVTIDYLLGRSEEKQITPKPEPRPASGLTDDDLAKIADLVQRKHPSIGENQPKTVEARILAAGVDKMPEADRERALEAMRLIFLDYADYFEKGSKDDDT